MADFQSGSGSRLHLEHMGSDPPLLVEAPSCEKPISISSLVGLEGDRTSSYVGSFNREGWEDATAIPFYSHFTNPDGRSYSASISNNGGAHCFALTTHTHLPTLTSVRAFSTSSTTSTPVSTPNSCLESAIRPVIPDNSCDNENPSSSCLNIEHPSPEDSSVNNAVNESAMNVTDLLAELERERQKNTELSEKISSLEAQLQPREKDSLDLSVQEHALYEQPGMRRKIFYPNQQNPFLCPVQILQEEKAMRPSDSSCPSCLFLCIKYGGRTRNLPQNEYVRQRMGRNKLKSFGPLICQMALLVHIRTGSFFFKALGITLLFMAGFPNDFVQKETKYHNLDLLQKYYRSDEDTEGEELFHTYPVLYATQAMTNAPSLQGKRVSGQGKLSGKKKPPFLLSKPHMPEKIYFPSISARSMSTRFGLVGFPTVPVTTGAALPSLPHHTFPSASTSSNIAITSGTAFRNSPFPPLPPYAIFSPFAVQRPPNGVLSMPMWHNVNSYPKNMYPHSSYGCQSIPPLYGSHRSHTYYNHSFFSSFPSDVKEGMGKDDELNESNSDLDSSSSEADEKCNQLNSSDDNDM